MAPHAPDADAHTPADLPDALPDGAPPPPIRERALAALRRQLDTLEAIAEDDTADYPQRLRAVEMIAVLAGHDLRPRGPKHGPPGGHEEGHGPPGKHAAKHAAKHASKHAPAKHPAKHAASKHAAGHVGAPPALEADRSDDAA